MDYRIEILAYALSHFSWEWLVNTNMMEFHGTEAAEKLFAIIS